MISVSTTFLNAQSSSVRYVKAKVGLYNGSTLINTYTESDSLKSFTIDRVGGDNKFYGTAYCQKITCKIVDMTRSINIPIGYILKAYIGFGSEYINYPNFKVVDVKRDEKDNTITITGYDVIYNDFTYADLNITSYTIGSLADAIATKIGVTKQLINVSDNIFNLSYPDSANFSGSETLRDVLTAIAEATQTICYISYDNKLTFKRMLPSASAVSTVAKSDYYDLTTADTNRLWQICSVTELGDNIEAHTTGTGSTQYIYENPLYNLRDDVGTLLTNAIGIIGGFTISTFDMKWYGNVALELGDRVAIVGKNNATFYSNILNDSITFDGSLREDTSFAFAEGSRVNANSATIGDKLAMTSAKVDKVNQTITLRIEDVEGQISTIEMTSDEIKSIVQGTAKYTASGTAPNNPTTGDIWEKTGTSPKQYYQWDGVTWASISEDKAKQLKVVNSISQTLDGVVYEGPSGTTVINGSYITTGTIDADKVNVINVEADSVSASDITAGTLNAIQGSTGISLKSMFDVYSSRGTLTGRLGGYEQSANLPYLRLESANNLVTLYMAETFNRGQFFVLLNNNEVFRVGDWNGNEIVRIARPIMLNTYSYGEDLPDEDDAVTGQLFFKI